jgi:hypothetical protein
MPGWESYRRRDIRQFKKTDVVNARGAPDVRLGVEYAKGRRCGQHRICGNLAWQDAKLLVEFRNSFMHFKPAWDHETDIHDGTLVKRLKLKMPVHRAYEIGFQFPYGFMTYDCTKWSLLTVLAFSAYFSTLLGLKDRFIGANLDYSLA